MEACWDAEPDMDMQVWVEYIWPSLSCIIEETYFHSSVLSNEPVCCLADYLHERDGDLSFFLRPFNGEDRQKMKYVG